LKIVINTFSLTSFTSVDPDYIVRFQGSGLSRFTVPCCIYPSGSIQELN